MDSAMKQLLHQFCKNFFLISKCLACNAEKDIKVEDNKKKRMSIASYINIYTYVSFINIYTYAICGENDSKQK